MSAVVHLLIILLLIFGVPVSSASSRRPPVDYQTATPLALQASPAFKPKQRQVQKPAPKPETPTPPPPPPPPLKEVELGPDSKKPDAPAKEAAAKAPEPDAKPPAVATPTPTPPAPPPTDQPKPPDAQPPAPQRILIPRPGDYTGVGALPLPTTSPWGPPKVDSASGAPPEVASSADAGSMGRTGLASRDPERWTNSFDDETSGRCVQIPDLGKNADGSPVLATVIGRVLDTDGRTALSGAHLQITGTAFGTFSDSRGEYRLEFDPKLLAKCRKQYVQVVAPGYRQQLLTLMIGPRVRSDDVVLRH
ncbi:MAG TPA: hypothetical protein VGL65_08655 [Gemmatimonadales bacterium]|jgi:hypothetical protein